MQFVSAFTLPLRAPLPPSLSSIRERMTPQTQHSNVRTPAIEPAPRLAIGTPACRRSYTAHEIGSFQPESFVADARKIAKRSLRRMALLSEGAILGFAPQAMLQALRAGAEKWPDADFVKSEIVDQVVDCGINPIETHSNFKCMRGMFGGEGGIRTHGRG